MAFWCLATSAPNRESWISYVLSALEIEHRIFYIRMVDAIRPIFPGYVFVNADNFDRVKNVTGILGFVKVEGQIVNVTEVVEQLETEGRGTNVLPRGDVVASKFRCGDRVQVQRSDHLLFGQVGQFQHYLDSGKVSVLLPWFGALVPTVIEECDLEHMVVRQRSRNRRSRAQTTRSVRC
jgi:transcription antitermination factor NusG